MTCEQISAYYLNCQSIKETAKFFHISPQKCRRILIENGEYMSPLSNRITELVSSGKSVEEIAKALEIKVKTVQTYMPYTKCVYNADSPTQNAIRIREHRDRLRKTPG